MKKLLFYFLLFFLPYLLAEALFSSLYVYGVIDPPDAWLFEESGRTLQFDPVRGYRLTSSPSRFARITRGETEYVGQLRGNNQGFADRDDFSPQRQHPHTLRLAVFGDSFTAAQYLAKNWPDAAEDLANQGKPIPEIELLNFSVDGAGLANWYSILMHIVRDEHYQIDGIVFAVFPSDLNRRFTVAEHRGYPQPMFGRSSWKPEEWPRNEAEARALLRPLGGDIVTPSQFQQALAGQWHPQLPRPWRPYFFLKLRDLCGLLPQFLQTQVAELLADENSEATSAPENAAPDNIAPAEIFNPEQLQLIQQMDAFAHSRSLPVLVFHLPIREDAVQGAGPHRDVELFAQLLHAPLVNGEEIFAGLGEEEIRASYLPYDGHWNQKGSDRFARFALPHLQEIQSRKGTIKN